ncbi:MAG: NAD(P)-dependent oxidoreductase, partial [Candidatus Latescibacterota bacterium]|nr:NAD(P)-dependent oxidoreductase [Candidatus Latescibacterota bacterium]
MSKRRVLVTGGAGRVASILRQHWGDRYEIRLADIRPVDDLASHETFVELDITDLDAFTGAC